jgi:hypothetical protein
VDREWQIDGYIVVGPIVQTDDVELWRARDRHTGTAVALRPLPVAAYEASSVRRLVARLAGVPHVAPVQTVLEFPEATVVVHDLPAGGTLAGLLDIRRHLTPGEVVTVGVPLAQALSAAHERGLVHGQLKTECVVFADDGRPSLLWPGSAQPSQAISDVEALRLLLRSLLDTTHPSPLDDVLTCDVDANALAQRLLGACAATPVRMRRPVNRTMARAGSHRVTAGSRSRPRRRLRRAMPGLGAVLSLAIAVGGGVFWANAAGGRAPTLPTTALPSPRSTAAAVGWHDVVRRLDERRDRAFLVGDVAALQQVYAPDSKPLAVDVAALRSLASRDLHARGLRLVLVAVTAVSVQPHRATLHVVDRLPAYDVVDNSGRVAAHRTERGPRGWRIELTRAGPDWLIAAIAAV